MTIQLSLFDKSNLAQIKHSKFKDKCDVCGRFDYLKGYDNYCICEKCLKLGDAFLQDADTHKK